nr:MAG TPA: hypothetical protein [Caudoviricetes sp.]
MQNIKSYNINDLKLINISKNLYFNSTKALKSGKVTRA